MTPLIFPVTFTFLGLLAVILIPMTGWVGLHRSKVGVLRGDGGHASLFKRTRIHGNLTENAPLFGLVLALAEAAGLSTTWLWLAVLSFIAGRILHYVFYDSPLRASGMLATQVPGALMGIWLISLAWG